MKRYTRLAILLVVLSAVISSGQSGVGNSTFSAIANYGTDSVSLQTLGVMFDTPVRSKTGAIPFSYDLFASSGCFYFPPPPSGPEYIYCGISPNKIGSINGSIGDAFGQHYSVTFGIQPQVLCPNGTTYTNKFINYVIVDPLGGSHPLPTSDYTDSASCLGGEFTTDYAHDGSGLTYTVAGGKVYTPDGTQTSTGPTAPVVDTYGNTISIAYTNGNYPLVYTDTLSATALLATPSVNTSAGSYSWTDVNGTSQPITETMTPATVKTAFGCSTHLDSSLSGSLLTMISYPDNSHVQLGYEPTPGGYTGRIQTITLRTGGTVTYSYSGGSNGLDCIYFVPPTMTRTTSEGTWTYTWTLVNNGNGNYGNTTSVVDPGGNKAVYTFTGLSNSGNAAFPTAQVLTQVQHYQGSSTLLSTTLICYNGNATNCSTAVVSYPISKRDVYTYPAGMTLAQARLIEETYDSYGNVLTDLEYNFNQILVSTTTMTYGTWNGSTCANIGSYIYSKTCEMKVTDSGAHTLADKRFSYDSHGNLLTSYVWNGSAWLSNTTPNSYSTTNGAILSSYDLANSQTTYAYNGTGGCNSLLPTSITAGGLTIYKTWNCSGGVLLTSSNPNGSTSVTTYGYANSSGVADPLWRLSSVTDPLGNKVWKSYTATSLNTSFSFNSSINNTTVTMDGYGRQINTQTQQGPSASNYDTASSAYSWSGNYRTLATSQPCARTLGGSCSTVHTNYMDPLGRLHQESTTSNETLTHTYAQNDDLAVLTPAPSGENSAGKQVQKQFDGLGRLTFECEISSTVSGNALCNQNTNTTAKGIVTTTSYTSAAGSQTVSSTRGSQTRSQTVDGLGRVKSSTTPEGGTITYLYDSGSTCGGSYPGRLVQKTFPTHYECYLYDTLARLTDVGAGYSGSGTTFCKRFRFDNSLGVTGTLPSGIAPQNPYGRVVEAETDNCTLPITPITDEWFSYDKDGHVTDVWEKTPHSGIYYHSVATFAGNGVPLTVQLANPSLYTMTYSLDGEGRPSTLRGNSTTVVSGTTFNASGQPTYIDLGTGTDQSDYVYDPNTGRMQNWTFQVGSTSSETSTLTWNPNGTLKTLAITDGFNAGGTQTCHFNPSDATGTGYDDIGRLVGIDCGSGGWGQTFSYDQYDNLTKAVISGRTGITWNPGYSPLNNHYSSGANYDNSGNLTYDTIHLYTWDQFGKLSSIDSSACGTNGECVTYDAMGRIVETSYNSAYTEIWYTQVGKAYMTGGSTPYYAYWPTPGNATVEVNGNAVTFYYMHKDWLGSARISSVIVNPAVVSDQAYAPYGEVYNKLATGAGVPAQMFTGDTQDIIGGILDTPNRELNASQGRWLSLDPAGTGWNLYAYSTNPNSNTDPSGLWTFSYSLGDLHGCNAFSVSCGTVYGLNEFDLFAIASRPLGDDEGNPIAMFPVHGVAWVPPSSFYDPVTQDFYNIPGYFTFESVDWNNPYYYYPSASAAALIASRPGQTAGRSGTPSAQKKTAWQILQCAAGVANSLSLAGVIGTDNPVGKAFLGNTFSGLVDLGNDFSADNGKFALDVALGGAGQGLPVGGGLAGKGLVGVATDAVINAATQPGTIETIGGVAELGEEGLAGPIGWAKLGYDALTFAYGAYKCK